jgi:hypothetical protein
VEIKSFERRRRILLFCIEDFKSGIVQGKNPLFMPYPSIVLFLSSFPEVESSA